MIEAQGKELNPEMRTFLRQTQAQEKLEMLHQLLNSSRKNMAPGSAMAKAIDYSLKRSTALQRYAQSGDLPIDNNPIENEIRPIAIGKKNWLFAGSERAGKRTDAIQSLLGTAKLNGLEPQAWLKKTLEQLPTWRNFRIDELLLLKSPAK